MSNLGILLACEHYPEVRADAHLIDASLRYWLADSGTTFDGIDVFAAYAGDLPGHAASCDAWILSGVPLSDSPTGAERADAMTQFLRAAASFGRPIYAINHAEHAVHAALATCQTTPPDTSPTLRAISNPFRSFQSRYQLFRFNPATRRVDALQRPAAICPRRMFGAFRSAA